MPAMAKVACMHRKLKSCPC